MLRNILSIVLALFILAAGCPAVREDGSVRPSGLDLLDSVRAVASFSRAAETPGGFKAGFRGALCALNQAAGLAQVISAQDGGAFQGVRALDTLFVPAPATRLVQDAGRGARSFPERFFSYESHFPSPPLRPPRA